jgi:hypothetical protein
VNKEESLALYQQGRDAWNQWAADMQAQRAALEAAGDWVEGTDSARGNDATRGWHVLASADFREHEFEDVANFAGYVFPGRTVFDAATFSGNAGFGEATFSGDAWFQEARFLGIARFGEARFSDDARFDAVTFSGDAGFRAVTFSGIAGFRAVTFSGIAEFQEATFLDYAWFSDATFSGDAWFSEVKFSGNAGFIQSRFDGYTAFDLARFERTANFQALQGKSVFSLADVTFVEVPNFWDAHFNEAPRLDNLSIEPGRFAHFTVQNLRRWVKSDRDRSARWRALKRLAVQGHDHVREQEFFKGEVTARRFGEDKPWHAVFWFGLVYQALSDFGRSMPRPLFWLLVCTLGFACFYAGESPVLRDRSLAGVELAWERVVATVTRDEAPPLACAVGPDDPWHAALGLSLRNAAPFAGIGSSEKLKQIYACLYGVHPGASVTPGQLPPRFTPVIPDIVSFVSVLQTVLSTVLLFLLLLAVRNHFRIK